MTANTGFEFRTLFVPVRWPFDGLSDAVRRCGTGTVKWTGKKKAVMTLRDGTSLAFECTARKKAGDIVARTAAGAVAFIRAVRVPAAQKRNVEHLAMRLFDTDWLIGCTTGTETFSNEARSAVDQLRRLTLAVSFDGWTMRDHTGALIVDAKKKVAPSTPTPLYYALGYSQSPRPPGNSRGVVLSGPFDAPDEDPVVGPAVERQIAFLKAKASDKTIASVKAEVSETLRACKVFYVARDSGEDGLLEPERAPPLVSGADIVLDGFNFCDGSGKVLLDRSA